MYVPDHFTMAEADARAHIRGSDVINLVTVNSGVLAANLVPVLYDEERGEFGTLVGHLAKANPQWSDTDPNIDAMAIFPGTDAYVSPSTYASKREHGRVVPTWNYVAVHAYGRVTWLHDTQRKLEIVGALTIRHEAQREDRWDVTDAPANFISALAGAIVGFELLVTRIDAKAKLSQNRSEPDRRGVVLDLAGGLSPGGHAVSAAMSASLRYE